MCWASSSSQIDPWATPRVPAHTHTKVTAHQNGSHIYVYGCVHTEVCVHCHDCSCVPTPNVHWHMVWNVVKAVRDALAHAGRGVTVQQRQQCEGVVCAFPITQHPAHVYLFPPAGVLSSQTLFTTIRRQRQDAITTSWRHRRDT